MTSASRLWTVKRSELKLKQQSWQGSCFQAWRQCSFMGSLIGNLTYPCGGQFFFSGVGAKVKKTYPGIPESNILKQYTLKQQFVKDFLSRGGLGMLQGSRGYAVVLVSWNLDSTVCYAVIWRVTHERGCGMMSGRVVLDSQRSSEAQSQSHHDSWLFAFFWWGVCHIETKLLDLACLKNGLTIPYIYIYITCFKGILAAHSSPGSSFVEFWKTSPTYRSGTYPLWDLHRDLWQIRSFGGCSVAGFPQVDVRSALTCAAGPVMRWVVGWSEPSTRAKGVCFFFKATLKVRISSRFKKTCVSWTINFRKITLGFDTYH